MRPHNREAHQQSPPFAKPALKRSHLALLPAKRPVLNEEKLISLFSFRTDLATRLTLKRPLPYSCVTRQGVRRVGAKKCSGQPRKRHDRCVAARALGICFGSISAHAGVELIRFLSGFFERFQMCLYRCARSGMNIALASRDI